MSIEIIEGWTGPIDFALKADGSAVDLNGITVTLLLKGNDGLAVDTTGDISILDSTAGTVRYLPDAADLTAAKSPYKARFKLVDGTGAIAYCPSGARDRWDVRVV
jgi:hypothetical protein